MKIVLVGPTYPYKGGGAQHTTELAHRLAAAGHDVVIESWRAQYPSFLYPGQQTIDAPEGEPFGNVRRELDWRRPDGWLRAGRRMRSADLVVPPCSARCRSRRTSASCAAWARPRRAAGAGPRVVALCHNVLPHERRPYDRPLMKALLRRVDTVLTHSEQQSALAAELTPVPRRVAVMPPHLPVRRGAAAATGGDAPQVRNRLLFFGLVRPYKGLDLLLRALAAGPPQVSLTVAGEFWGGLEETKALIAELGLADRVELRPGYVPAEEVPALFAEPTPSSCPTARPRPARTSGSATSTASRSSPPASAPSPTTSPTASTASSSSPARSRPSPTPSTASTPPASPNASVPASRPSTPTPTGPGTSRSCSPPDRPPRRRRPRARPEAPASRPGARPAGRAAVTLRMHGRHSRETVRSLEYDGGPEGR